MGIIQDIGTQIDGATVDYLQSVFTAVAEPVSTLMKSIGVVALLFIAINHIFQVQSVHYSKYLSWGVTYVIVVSFATIWSNFSPVYNALTGITQGYSNLVVEAVAKDIETLRADILDPGKITGAGEAKTYAAMDEFGHAIVWIAGDFFRDTSITNLGKTFRNIFSGVVVLVVGGIFIAASAVMVLIAKVGIILAISLAPLGIMMFMWDKTRQYFQGWVSLLIGFSVIPLLLGCLMAIVLYFAAHLLANSGASSHDKSKFFGFVFVMIAALVLLFHIPTMAQTLASASVAVGGGSVGRALTSIGGRMSGISNVRQYAQFLPQRALGQMFDPRKYGHAAQAAIGAARSGASLRAGAMSTFAAWRRHTDDRKSFWRNRREQGVIGGAQMVPNPAFQSYRPPSASQSESGSGQGAGQMSPEQRKQYET
ncbi:type IV secretion system protein VirB6 [Agrobacterium larrymoorei]|uniref:Type IV secretion system protein VirB6 n=1 Tax=Agrobacterium larrymoorei TaxID=160699 RepID=A0AAJ2BFG7_9HYPH|nr:type IV secretion system protein VirB6 [Agrobacterium larrymoorei]